MKSRHIIQMSDAMRRRLLALCDDAADADLVVALTLTRQDVAALVEKHRREGAAMTFRSVGAPAFAIAEAGLEIAEASAYRWWHRYYGSRSVSPETAEHCAENSLAVKMAQPKPKERQCSSPTPRPSTRRSLRTTTSRPTPTS